jgi:hypothetical protein
MHDPCPTHLRIWSQRSGIWIRQWTCWCWLLHGTLLCCLKLLRIVGIRTKKITNFICLAQLTRQHYICSPPLAMQWMAGLPLHQQWSLHPSPLLSLGLGCFFSSYFLDVRGVWYLSCLLAFLFSSLQSPMPGGRAGNPTSTMLDAPSTPASP